MRVDWLRRLAQHEGPFATVATTGGRDGGAAARWGSHARRLTAAGAPCAVVEAMGGVVRSATRRGGEVGRVVVAGRDGVLLDQVLPERPPAERTTWGPVPDLVPVVRGLARSTRYLLVEVDPVGAHVQAVSARGDELEAATVLGDHDELDRLPGGGWSHRRFRTGSDAGGPDAVGAQVARVLGLEVRRHRPELVLVAGADEEVEAVLRSCAAVVTERVVRVGAAPGAGADAPRDVRREVARALDLVSRRRTDQVLDRFAGARPDRREAVSGLGPVLAAFRGDQVAELVLVGPGTHLLAWATGLPHQVGATARELVGAGREPVRLRADLALVWAAVGAGAGVSVVPRGDRRAPATGVGALLRGPARTGTWRG